MFEIVSDEGGAGFSDKLGDEFPLGDENEFFVPGMQVREDEAAGTDFDDGEGKVDSYEKRGCGGVGGNEFAWGS